MVDQILRYVLDSFALLAYFQNEPGWEQVESYFEKAQRGEIYLYLNNINLGECYYIISRLFGNIKAQSMLSDIKQLPIVIYEVTSEDVISAAKLKAITTISYSDAFAASSAQTLNATLITGDPEFKNVEKVVNIEWLPPKRK